MIAITAERLAEDAEGARALIAQLDPSRPADRRLALDAAEGLVDRWVAPAERWFVGSDEEPGFRRLDPRSVAGEEIHGLSLGLLARDFPSLREAPENGELREALEEQDIEIATPERRAAFFRAWMAQRALYIVRDLLGVVREDPGLDAGEAAWELERLRGLRDGPLPTLERDLIERIIERRT